MKGPGNCLKSQLLNCFFLPFKLVMVLLRSKGYFCCKTYALPTLPTLLLGLQLPALSWASRDPQRLFSIPASVSL